MWWCNLKARGNPLYLLYSRLFHNLVGTCISFLLLGSKLPQTQQLKITYFLPPCSTEVQVGSTGFSAESHKAKIKMSARLDLIWRLREESTSRLTQDVGRIHLFVVIGLRCPIPFWLSDRGCHQVVTATIFPSMWPPPSSNSQWHIKSFLQLHSQQQDPSPCIPHTHTLTLIFCSQLNKLPAFRGSCD